jgi:hypothetical protein
MQRLAAVEYERAHAVRENVSAFWTLEAGYVSHALAPDARIVRGCSFDKTTPGRGVRPGVD